MARHLTVTSPDGRALAAAEWGDPAGDPVVALHGTPGSRYTRPPLDERMVELGLRVVTYDRAGYGESDRHRGRRVVDCVPDILAVVDDLGLERFCLTGTSGGGPHALAAAARMADRLVRVRANVSVAPHDAEGLDFLAGMDPENVQEFGWAEAGEETLTGHLREEAAGMLERLQADPSNVLGDAWELPEADLVAMRDPAAQQQLREGMGNAFTRDVFGWVDDDLAFVGPWGFDLAEITVPVEVSYGAQDVMVPAGHGAWLAAHVPGAVETVDHSGGHMKTPLQALDGLRAFADGR